MPREEYFNQENHEAKIYDGLRINFQTFCWEWQKACKHGYGVTSKRNVQKLVHREMWEIYTGWKLIGDIHICHKCDNPKCCNPEHLFAGTAKDNVRDMYEKNRQADFKKIARNKKMTKLSYGKIKQIKQLRSQDQTLEQIAKQFDIAFQTVSKIVNNKLWA